VDERDLLWQQFINAKLNNGMRLPAANLHDVPRTLRDPMNFLGDPLG
jgi:hypothetical protein